MHYFVLCHIQSAQFNMRFTLMYYFVNRWFQLGSNPHTGREDWLFTGRYFDRKWSLCEDIF